MIKGLKKLQAALFAVAVLLMFALVFTFVYGAGSGNEILPVAEASAETYEHGTLATQTPQNATSVSSSNVSQFSSLISSNKNISLTSDITLPYFLNTSSYSGTIYGNGHTITVNVPDSSGQNNVHNMSRTVASVSSYIAGGVIGELTGRIYDCKFVLGSGDYKIGGQSSFVFGGIIGYLNGGTVSNVQVEVLTGTDFRVYCWSSDQRCYFGMLTGAATANATVTNVTVVNNGGTFRTGYADTSFSSIYTDCDISISSNLIGYIEGANTIDNIIVKGGTTDTVLSAKYAANIGAGYDNNLANMTNFYNAFGVLNASGAAEGRLDGTTASALIFASTKGESGASQLKVQNYYEYYNSDQDSTDDKVNGVGTAPLNSGQADKKISIAATVGIGAKQGARDISFDPTTPTYAQSLVVIYTGQAKAGSGMTRTWILTPRTGEAVTASAVIEGTDTDTVVFRRLTSGYSSWGDSRWGANDGIFTASLTAQDSEAEPPSYPALTQYEHGNVGSQTTTGTPISSAREFSEAFSPSGNATDGSYYLTRDIVISGFSGHDFSGMLDGNGHTIFIDGLYQQSYDGQYVGGLFGTLSGTVKNVRVVLLNSVTVNSANENNIGVGLIAGRLNGGTVENVNAVISEGATLSTTVQRKTTALGAVAGVMEGSGTLTNVTVQLDGILDVNGSWSFVAGFVGRSMKPNSNSAPIYNFSNIIIKGEGRFSGTATGDTAEPKYVGVVTVLQGSTGTAQVDINGLIYNLTTDWNNANDDNATTPVEGVYASYGWVAQNLYNAGGTQAAVSAEGYVNYVNIFEVEGAAFGQYMNAGSPGNTYIQYVSGEGLAGTANARRTALISNSISGVSATHTVTPYFVPNGADTSSVTLVAHSSDWLGTGRLQTNGNGTGDYRAEGNYKIVTVAKENAYDSIGGTITLSEYVAATANAANKNVTYNGAAADFGITVTVGDRTLTPGDDYTLNFEGTGYNSSEAPVNAGTYSVTVTLNADNDYNFENNGNLVKSLTISGLVIAKADLPDTVTVSIEGWTYGASENAPQMSGLPSGVTEENVSYTYTGRGDTSYSDSNPPANAGEYTVTATIEPTSNYNGGTVSADFTVAKAPFPEGISVTMDGWTYGGAPKSPSINGADKVSGAGRTFLYEGMGATEYSSSDRPSDAGTYTLTVTYDESTNYVGGSVTSAEFTISPKEVEFRLETSGLVFGTAGSVTLNPNTDDATENDTVTWDVQYDAYWEANGEQQAYSASTPAGTMVTFSYALTAVDYDNPENENHNFVAVFVDSDEGRHYGLYSIALEVQAREIGIEANSDVSNSAMYGNGYSSVEELAALFNLTNAPSGIRVAVGDLFRFTVQEGATLPNAGTYNISIEFTDDSGNYTLAEGSLDSYSYTITPFIVTGSIEPSAEYSGSAFTPEWTVTETLPNNETQEDMEVSVAYALNNSDSGVTTIQNVGQYTVTVTLGNTNYAFVAGEGTSQEQDYSFEVTKAENIFTTEFGASWTYGEGPTIEPPVAKFGDVSVTYYSDDSYNNVVESFSSTTAAGTYYYVITVEESANWTNESMTLSGSFVIEKAQTTVTLSVEEGAVFDGAAYDGKITVELGNSAVSLGDVTWQYKVGDGGWTEGLPVNAGTYTVSIKAYSNSANVTVTNVGDATAQLIISPKDITFNAELAENASLTYGDTLEQDQMNALVNVGVAEGQESIDFTFTVSLMVGDVAFGSTTAANAIVTVSVEVTATDSNYNAVNPAALELTVQRRVITGALRATSATYDGAVQTVEFVPVNVANGDAVTFAYSYTLNNNYAESILGAGTYTVKVTLAGDNTVNNNYILDVDELTFTVEKLTINATLTASGTAVQDGAIDITGSDKITFDTDTNGVLVIMLGGEEVARVTVTFAADDGTQYTPDGIAFAIAHVDFGTGIEAGTGVTRRSVTVSFSDTNFALGETLGGVTFEVSGNISVADGITSTVTYEPGTSYDTDYFKDNEYFVTSNPDDVANITVTIYRSENASGEEIGEGIISDAGTYYVQGAIDGAVAGFKFTIARKTITVTVNNAEELVYTGSGIALDLSSDFDEMLNADGVTLGYEVQGGGSILNAGDYTITFTLTGDKSANYAFSSAGTTVHVEKAQIEIDFEVSDVTYSGEEVQDPVPSGNLGGGDVTVTFEAVVGSLGENNRPVGVGEYRVTVIVAETENYFGDTLEKTFSVTPKSVAASITNANDLVYDGTVHALTLESEGIIDGDDVTLGYQLGDGTQNIIAADTYTVTFTLAGDDSGNYALVSETASVTVRKAELTVTVENEGDLIYNNAVHELALMLDGVCGDDRVSVDYALEDGTQNIIAADTYTVTFTLTGDDSGNYALVSETATVTVQKREVSVTLTQTEFTYSGSEIVLDYDVDDDVFAGDSVLAEYGSDFDMLNAGKYEVTFALTGDAADNYNLTNPSHTVTVNPANVTASISAPSATYDGAAYDGSITVALGNAGLSLGEITWQYRVGDGGWTEGLPVNAGTYTISIKTYSNSGNVTVTNLGDATAQLVIDKAQVRYTATLAEGAEIVFGDTFTQEQMNALVTVTDDGGVTVDTYTVRLELADGSAYDASVPVGTAVSIVIVPVVDEANYEVTVTEGLTLSVQSKAIDIVLDTDGNGETDEDKISSGATVTIQQGESLALAAAVEAFLEEQGIPAGSYRILIDGAEFAGTENLAARTYRMQVSLTGGYQGVLEFMLTVEGDDEPVAPPVDPDEPDDPDPDEPVDPDPEEPVDPDEPGTPDEPEQPAQPDGEGFPGWAIAVIVCGGLLVIAAVTGIAVAAARKRKKSGDKK